MRIIRNAWRYGATALTALAVVGSPVTASADEPCGLPWVDIWDSTDTNPENWTLYDKVHVIQTATSGMQHYNYYSVSAHPLDVNVDTYNANIWVHENTNGGDLTFGFVFSKDNSPDSSNHAKIDFRIVGSTTNPYVAQGDEPYEVSETPAGSNAFVGNFAYGYNTDGIAVSGLGGDEWTVIIDSVDFGDIEQWFAASGDVADFSTDVTLVMGSEYRLTPACHVPSGKPVDVQDDDTDGDGVIDDDDNCVTVANPGQTNSDGDFTGDACDSCPFDFANDADGDGACADVDNCPNSYNADQADGDGDGVGDVCDICPSDATGDSDGDGMCDGSDNCPADFNADQSDVDNDGVGDVCDYCPVDPNNDSDGDGVCGDVDNCVFLANSDQADYDLDGHGDACDVCPADPDDDADADGFCGDVDNCPATENGDQLDADSDGYGDVCDDDDDNDGVDDTSDNCPLQANGDQSDIDGDGAGDVCDEDADGDDVPDNVDACLGTALGDVVDATGCSVAQLCPCSGAWKNHGAYVSCVAHAVKEFVDAGLISEEDKGAIVSEAGGSACGQKK